MTIDMESQCVTNDRFDYRTRGLDKRSRSIKTIVWSIILSMILSCVAVFIIFFCILKPSLKNIPCTVSPSENRSEIQPMSSKLSTQQNNLYGKFEIQQELLDKLKNNSSLNETAYPKLNWTHSFTEEKRQSAFRLDNDGCVIIPRTGYWFVHSEVSFAYTNTSEKNIWVYIRVNNSVDIRTKKTFTLPNKKYRPLKAHLPVDLTNIIRFNETDTLCVEVSDWRIVYPSGIDNSLTLVYLSIL